MASGATLTKIAGERRRMVEIIRFLRREYPDVKCFLDYASPFQLLVATILSAQCTDERVNKTTPSLFSAFPDAARMAAATPAEVERLIRPTGFYRNKAKAILETSQLLVEKYGGDVPRTLEELVALRGVGRKTANVLLGNAFGIPGFVVDTHVGRLTRRMGFTKSLDPEKVEREVGALVPREDWTPFSLWLIAHGRAVCTARVAKCGECGLVGLCPRTGISKKTG